MGYIESSVTQRHPASPADLAQPAEGGILAAQSVGDMAEVEGYTPEIYAFALSEKLRYTSIPLDVQRERLAALVGVGAKADKAAADELARHYLLLEALSQRFALEAVEAIDRGGPKAAEAAERFAHIAVKAQRAGVACLSALKTLRDAPSPDNGGGGDSGGDGASGPVISSAA